MSTQVPETSGERETLTVPGISTAPVRSPWPGNSFWDPPEVWDERLRTRRRSRSRNRLRRLLVRIALATLIAMLVLALFEGTAHGQTEPKEQSEELRRFLDEVLEEAKDGDSEDSESSSNGMTTGAVPTPASAPAADSRPASRPRRMPPRDAQSGTTTPSPADAKPKNTELSRLTNRELDWSSTLDLILHLENEFRDHSPFVDPEVVRHHIVESLIELSVRVGHTDNPRENLEALRLHLRDTLGLVATDRETPTLERLLTRSVLPNKRGSSVGFAMIALALADRVNSYLDLEPVRCGDVFALRYRSGDHRYILVPTSLDRLMNDREFATFAVGTDRDNTDIESLTRREFWGLVLGEAGTALQASGNAARARRLIRRALELFPGQATPRVALARMHVNDLEPESAREELDMALAVDPDHLTARLERAELLESLGENGRAEADLRWLYEEAGVARAGIEWAERLLERGEPVEAAHILGTVPQDSLSPADLDRVQKLTLLAKATPWIERLTESRESADRFAAIDALSAFEIDEVDDALVGVLDDPNLRLANYAWALLRRRTGAEIPREVAAWTRFFEARRARTTGPSGR